MKRSNTIRVQGTEISIYDFKEADYISLTDIVRAYDDGNELINNWLRNRNTIEYLGVWEQLYNEGFNSVEFDGIKKEAGLNRFRLSVKKWTTATGAIGIRATAGRYGKTIAHKDIALNFCYWLSPAFQLYVVKEFQRLKEEEAERKRLDWNIHRVMAKANYRIHTEAVRQHLIPPRLQNTKKAGLYFASEADMINLALFGLTAKQWRSENPEAKGNMRDHATPEQLLVLSNLQSLNAKLMKWGCDEEQRLQILNESAIEEMSILLSGSSLKDLPPEQKKLNK
ncbi:MAG: KilA-N domain-containing protein [Bacteroidota bacterium]